MQCHCGDWGERISSYDEARECGVTHVVAHLVGGSLGNGVLAVGAQVVVINKCRRKGAVVLGNVFTYISYVHFDIFIYEIL